MDYPSFGLELIGKAFSFETFQWLVLSWVVYRIALALYNVSPLAAMTFAYEAWYDFVPHVGRYGFEIKKMHEKYGPIVRINPEELHTIDQGLADAIYAGGGEGRFRDKHQHYLNTMVEPLLQSTFATRDHETHRIRRSAISRFFSRQQILKLEPEVHELAQHLCDKMEQSAGPIELSEAFNCFTADTISQYAFGQPLGFLAQEGWKPNFRAATLASLSMCYVYKFIPVLRAWAYVAPYLVPYLQGSIRLLMEEMTVKIPTYVRRAMDERADGRIFSELLGSKLPDEEKTVYRLSGEGFSLMSAGTETTATALSMITYNLLSQPRILARLRGELDSLVATDPKALKWNTLERSPYLYGVIYEALRLTYGVSTRNPRIARDEDLVYQKGSYNYVIPKGTPIGMSSVMQHHDEAVFPESYKYKPERWLDAAGERNHELEKYLFTFSKGTRQCLGMNLALCELSLVTAALALRVLPRAELYETTDEDVAFDHELVLPQIKKGLRGVQIIVK
ncbi:cytochrome P450 monooxygenase aflU [Apiospora hydei]|uniref:Cytochrome P450 monooxygenase aflU n=1 Tax=Apiospora hydei TaxID=1337664 RepID=A0ABR1WBF9_9PEZI